MRLFDLHSHWGTERGYVLRSEAALAQQKKTWNSTPSYDTEDEMAAYLRKNEVRAILDFGFTKSMPHADRRSSRGLMQWPRSPSPAHALFLAWLATRWGLERPFAGEPMCTNVINCITP